MSTSVSWSSVSGGASAAATAGTTSESTTTAAAKRTSTAATAATTTASKPPVAKPPAATSTLVGTSLASSSRGLATSTTPTTATTATTTLSAAAAPAPAPAAAAPTASTEQMPRVFDLHNQELNRYVARLHLAIAGPERAWWLAFAERRLLSKERRIARQVASEAEWDETCLAGFWHHLRGFAVPANDYAVPAPSFTEYLLSVGIDSPVLQERVARVFIEGGATATQTVVCVPASPGMISTATTGSGGGGSSSGGGGGGRVGGSSSSSRAPAPTLSALVLCKAIHTALTTDDARREGLLRHCFAAMPLETVVVVEEKDSPLGEAFSSEGLTGDAEAETDAAAAAAAPAALSSPTTPADLPPSVATTASATVPAVEPPTTQVVSPARVDEALKKISDKKKKKRTATDVRTAALLEGFIEAFPFYRTLRVDEGMFTAALLLPTASRLLAALAKPLLEACTKYFCEPFGSFPLIPPRWRQAVAPLPFDYEPSDADGLLIRQVEQSGVDPNAKKPAKRRRASKKKKSDSKGKTSKK